MPSTHSVTIAIALFAADGAPILMKVAVSVRKIRVHFTTPFVLENLAPFLFQKAKQKPRTEYLNADDVLQRSRPHYPRHPFDANEPLRRPTNKSSFSLYKTREEETP